jgi:uncharacterized protein (TIGR02118 family)
MITVSVMYANTPDARFDHNYYRDTHMPLLKARMGAACLSYSIEKGIGGIPPGTPAPYIAMCHIHCESVDAFLAAFGPHMHEILADIPNYTDLQPQVQMSEIVVL